MKAALTLGLLTAACSSEVNSNGQAPPLPARTQPVTVARCMDPTTGADSSSMAEQCPQTPALQRFLALACGRAELAEAGAALAALQPELESACPGATRLLVTGEAGAEAELTRLCKGAAPEAGVAGLQVVGAALLRQSASPAWADLWLRGCRR